MEQWQEVELIPCEKWEFQQFHFNKIKTFKLTDEELTSTVLIMLEMKSGACSLPHW